MSDFYEDLSKGADFLKEQIFPKGADFFRYFQVCIEIWENATAILQNATRCTLKKFGFILKLNCQFI
jgi:hypothetical protein